MAPRPRIRWRQKGLAAALSGVILFPLIHGTVQETMPEGIIGLLQRSNPHTRMMGGMSTDHSRTTLDDVIARSEPRTAHMPLIAHKTAAALDHLGAQDLQAYEHAGRMLGIDPALLTTISIIESDGGVNLSPRAYTSSGDHVPFGHHHVKPRDLISVLDQVEDARSFYAKLVDLDAIRTEGWGVVHSYDSLPDEVREVAESAFEGTSGARRTFALAALVPELPPSFDPENLTVDLTDPYESALAAGVMIIYSAAYFASHDIPIDRDLVMLAYTAGSSGTRDALGSDASSLDHERLDEIARTASGEWGAWYLEAGARITEHLSAYGSLAQAQDDAKRVMRLTDLAPEANASTIGHLYVMMQKNPELYDQIVAGLVPEDDDRENINRVVTAHATGSF